MVVTNEEQYITVSINNYNVDEDIHVTVVYEKCLIAERKDLWESIENISSTICGPWCVGGDFNVIMDLGEKLGGRPHRAQRSFDFITTMDTCGDLVDIGYVSARYTWCNNRRPSKRIWKTVDRILVNDK